MNTSRFVCGSSLILAGWLGATFLNEVPSQRYPKLDRSRETATAEKESPALVEVEAPKELHASITR